MTALPSSGGSVPISVCARCGVAPPLAPDGEPRCRACTAPLELITRSGTAAWARFGGWFACRGCGLRSPFLDLPTSGVARCLHCSLASPFDTGAVLDVLASGHDNVDVLHGHVPKTFRPPRRDLLADASTGVMDEWEVEVLPGAPVCPGCQGELTFDVEGPHLVAACARCGHRERFRGLEAPFGDVGWVLDEAHRGEPTARRAPGATALLCPACGGPLPASTEPTLTCSYCKTTSRLPLEARAGAVAPVWVCFRGESRVRHEHRAHVEQERAPAPRVAAAPPSGRRFETLFVVAVVVVGVVAGVLGVLSKL